MFVSNDQITQDTTINNKIIRKTDKNSWFEIAHMDSPFAKRVLCERPRHAITEEIIVVLQILPIGNNKLIFEITTTSNNNDYQKNISDNTEEVNEYLQYVRKVLG